MKNDSLYDLYLEHEGKVSDKWHSYLEIYDEQFASLRESPIRLLEIGIQNGGSLEIWSRYFPNGSLFVGCDIDPKCSGLRYDDDRIHVIIGDANTDETQNEIRQNSDMYDLIADDGSHRSSDIITTFSRYFSMVQPGGTYVIEDLHCSYWEAWQGGLNAPYSAMSFLRRLADVVNAEHWGDGGDIRSQLKGFERHWNLTLDEHHIALIQSVSFHNSVCIIRKSVSGPPRVGSRVVAGQERMVADDPLLRSGHEVGAIKLDLDKRLLGEAAVVDRPPSSMGEGANPWGAGAEPMEEVASTIGELRLAGYDPFKTSDFVSTIKDVRALYPEEQNPIPHLLDDAVMLRERAEVQATKISELQQVQGELIGDASKLRELTETQEKKISELRLSYERIARNPLLGFFLWLKFMVLSMLLRIPFLSSSSREKMRRSAEKRAPQRFRAKSETANSD
ncbi:class I SAM-dependent methyltransferase [Ruegeria sp. Alg231-54]|uniref:class I SAM-dependent methyltransferase n=1 Tax=Ruegeria sp. Alg231-54 TaxID=1922221 RepID=UPI000D54C9AA|nr:class I SAM-dependent methyltransferase [Ruegeria sp. Alg231-54]